MVTPPRLLAASLEQLKSLQEQGRRVIPSKDLSRVHRQRLVKAGFLREIIKGWYMPTRPDEQPRDTTAWHASMRDFIRGYCDERFGAQWHVSPELSLSLYAGVTALPKQVLVYATKGRNNVLRLPADTSLFDYAAKDPTPEEAIVEIGGLRALALPMALVRASPTYFAQNSRDARIALWQLPDASALLAVLLARGQSVVAGRVAAALRAVGRPELADEIVATMEQAGYAISEDNPFTVPQPLAVLRRESPYALRTRDIWADMRKVVIKAFDPEPGPTKDIDAYLADVEHRYVADAYHSLSIEGYQVSVELIERVRSGAWNPDALKEDKQARDAMAARGYWLAHNKVKNSIVRILKGENPGEVLRIDHGAWFRELFAPSVQLGILKPHELAGYRNGQVYIRNSMQVPPSKEAVRDMMPVLFQLLKEETSAAVRVTLGHFVFVFIHPYMDGNGRIGRFLMNALLASGGYPWTVIEMRYRPQYMDALEEASVKGNIEPFAELLGRLVREQTRVKPVRPRT